MSIDVVIEDTRWAGVDIEMLAQVATDAVLLRMGLAEHDPEIDLLACDDLRIATLNTEFRGKPTPTNVLSWPTEDLSAEDAGANPSLPQSIHGEMTLGDIAISYDTCLAEATAQGKPLTAHVTHLIVHGLLHLLGYDHIRDRDATLMEGLEIEILGKLGLDDPYRN